VIALSVEILERHAKLTQHIIDFDKPESYKNLVVGDDFSVPLEQIKKMLEVKHLEKLIINIQRICRGCIHKME
jgi:hypothetical protein